MKKFYVIGRDMVISKLLNHFNMTNALIVYNYITTSPIDIVIYFLTAKFGLSKFAILLILAFL